MQSLFNHPVRFVATCLLFGGSLFNSRPAAAAGVTIITHGLNGNASGWVSGMANQIPTYYRFPGTSYTLYNLYFVPSGGGYNLVWSRLGSSVPSASDSGEIIVTFDWSQLADGNFYNTYQIASVVASALMSTNFISELNGHALAELPIHLIGHSRGGSLMCEASRLLGTNGVWVDHLTTLDPHPLNNDGFTLDGLLYSAVDAPCATYQNILFHDNYWENIGLFVYGEQVSGAYVRQLYNVSGGYENVGDTHYPHSNAHLMYHGSVDFRNPASDTEALINNTERTNWWTSYEYYGFFSGFYYSLIGGGNRLTADQPVGAGFPSIRDGYNQAWDLGAGTGNNRTALSTNNGAWPSLIKIDRTETNKIVRGQSTPIKLYWQWAQPVTSNAVLSLYLDNDWNPLNTNSTLLKQITVPGGIYFLTTNLTLSASNAALGFHAFYAKISANGRTRFMYAPELVEVVSNPPPTLDVAKISPTQFRVGVSGLTNQQIILQYSSNMQGWLPALTNTLSSNRWVITNTPPISTPRRFYRAVVVE